VRLVFLFSSFRREGDRVDLVLDAQEKFWGPGYLRFGLFLESQLDGESDFTILTQYRHAFVDRLGAEWRTLARMGSTMGLQTDFYQPLTYSGLWFVDPSLDWSMCRRDVYVREALHAPVEEHRLEGRFESGRVLERFGELRAGIYRGRVRIREWPGYVPQSQHQQRGGWRGRFIYDRLDNRDFPTGGAFGEAELLLSRRSLGADVAYDRLDLRFARAMSHGRNSVVLRGRLTSDLGTAIPITDQGWLGGLANVSGLESGELQDDNLIMGALTAYHRVGRLLPFLGRYLNLGVSVEAGGAWPTLTDSRLDRLRLGSLAFLGLDTYLGPIVFGWGWADQGRNSAYFQLGRIF
jgi:NTE family protein